MSEGASLPVHGHTCIPAAPAKRCSGMRKVTAAQAGPRTLQRAWLRQLQAEPADVLLRPPQLADYDICLVDLMDVPNHVCSDKCTSVGVSQATVVETLASMYACDVFAPVAGSSQPAHML